MSKLSIEQANELFTKMGLQVAVVAEGNDESADLDIIHKGIFNDVEEKMRSEVSFEEKDKAEKAALGRHLNSMRVAFAREYGINKKEIEEMTAPEMIAYAAAKQKEMAGSNQDEILSKLNAANSEREMAIEALRNDYEGKLKSKESEFDNYLIQERLTKVINGIPRRDNVDPLIIRDVAMSTLSNEYVPKYNREKQIVEFFYKDRPEQIAFDGKNQITDQYYANKVAERMGALATDTRDIPPSKVDKTALRAGVAQVPKGEYKSAAELMGKA